MFSWRKWSSFPSFHTVSSNFELRLFFFFLNKASKYSIFNFESNFWYAYTFLFDKNQQFRWTKIIQFLIHVSSLFSVKISLAAEFHKCLVNGYIVIIAFISVLMPLLPVCQYLLCMKFHTLIFLGFYCSAGSSAPTPCPVGRYTNSTRTITCLVCPIGHYCVPGTSDPVPCPEGYWCQAQSGSANLIPCAIGTFLNTTGGQKALDCLSCSPGYAINGSELSLSATLKKSILHLFADIVCVSASNKTLAF